MSELVKVDDGEPVPLWALNVAAADAGFSMAWKHVVENHPAFHPAYRSVTAHARTLAKYEKPPSMKPN